MVLFFVSFLCILQLFSSLAVVVDGEEDGLKTGNFKISIGVIVDYSSYDGKEDKVAIKMAVDDFYKYCSASHKPVLHFRDSCGNPGQATFVADELIKVKKVQAIIGLRTWEETATIAEIGNKAQVPVLSLADPTPSWASQWWPFLGLAVHSQYKQMKVVADIVKSWQWRRVTLIYEETSSSSVGIIPYLTDSLREAELEIDYTLPLSPLASNSSLSEELDKLKSRQCRVFIVHTSLTLATHLFMQAKGMGMLTKDYVWITTNGITHLLDSASASVISSMQGVLGVKSYFSKTTTQLRDFSLRFRSRFHAEYPVEAIPDSSISSLQAYDAAWAVALAIEGKMVSKMMCNSTYRMTPGVVASGQRLLSRILSSNFKGLTGEFRFTEGKLPPSSIFQIINVVGKSYRELGYWLEGSGFLESINGEGNTNSTSIKVLGQVFWPGGPWSVPRGWALPTSQEPLRIGVPTTTTFEEFVKVRYNNDSLGSDPSVNGFSIDVFKAALEYLPYHLSYKFIPYEGTYDSLVNQVHLKVFDAVVADTAIVANRCQHVQFSQPYADSGLQIVAYDRSRVPNRAWLFLRPFTAAMWGLTGGINIYNGFVVWLIERKNLNLKGSALRQIGSLIWLAFTTLFAVHAYGGQLRSNLSRMTMVVWLFVAIVITSSYTASLTSMLTIRRLDRTIVTLELLKKSNAIVGCNENSFVVKYLETVLQFNPKNIKRMNSGDDYPQALKNGDIAAAFLEVPYVKVLLSKYCGDLIVAGTTFKVGGFGFVFPKGSLMIADISEAVLRVSESGKLRDLENALVSNYNCSSSESNSNDHDSLEPNSFWGLFGITMGTSTVALVIFGFRRWACESSVVYIDENHAHDPDRDEKCMFEAEMKNLTPHRESGEPSGRH